MCTAEPPGPTLQVVAIAANQVLLVGGFLHEVRASPVQVGVNSIRQHFLPFEAGIGINGEIQRAQQAV